MTFFKRGLYRRAVRALALFGDISALDLVAVIFERPRETIWDDVKVAISRMEDELNDAEESM